MHICTKRSPERQGHALLLHPHHYLCFACRYMRVYNAAIKDRAFTYAIFFMFFFIHIIFCVWSAISPPLPFSNDWSHTGFMSAIKAIGSNTFTGVIFIIGACFWTLETLWSLWCLKMVSPKCSADKRLLTSVLIIAWQITARL